MKMSKPASTLSRSLSAGWFALLAASLSLVGLVLVVPNELVDHVGRDQVFWLGAGLVLVIALVCSPLLIAAAIVGTRSRIPRPTPTFPTLGGFALYVVVVATASSLLALVTLVSFGPRIGAGEQFEELALLWAVSNLAYVGGALLSFPLYRKYRAAKQWYSPAVLFLVNVLGVLLVGILTIWVWVRL
jgi:hypothetical protein